MPRTPRYYMLVASLPPLPARFTNDQVPISQLRLQRRLQMLEPNDRAELTNLETLMRWDRTPLAMSDRDFLARVSQLVPLIRPGPLRDVVVWRLEYRTVVAALRRRAAGRPAPTPDEQWGYGRWVHHIERSWSVSDFGIGGVLSWLPEFIRLMEEGDTLGFERELLNVSWTHMSQVAQGHFFTFEAVALYVLRWELIARWTEYNATHARERYNSLVHEGLGDFEHVFAATS